MRQINAGANFIVKRSLYQSSGAALLLASLTSLTVELLQKGAVLETWTYNGSTWTTGFSADGTSGVKLEVSSAQSLTLDDGKVSLRWTLVFPNAEFSVDGGKQIDPIIQEIAYVCNAR
ncbi:MAG: hypothetical protein K2X93_17280 [Candidatus Obscuribacterales bacterium]|nr:hypothetical protein [Candidatus Obscuribacterales bacterium]